MARILLAAAALYAASAVSAAVAADDGFAGTTFAEAEMASERIQQDFYLTAPGASSSTADDVPMRVSPNDFLVIFKGEGPQTYSSSRGYAFGDPNISDDGLTFNQGYLISTVPSSVDDRERSAAFMDGVSRMRSRDLVSMPAEIAPVPEAHEWAMIAAGMGVVGFAARRRNAAVA